MFLSGYGSCYCIVCNIWSFKKLIFGTNTILLIFLWGTLRESSFFVCLTICSHLHHVLIEELVGIELYLS